MWTTLLQTSPADGGLVGVLFYLLAIVGIFGAVAVLGRLFDKLMAY